MNVVAAVVEQLDYDGRLRSLTMQPDPGRPLTIAFLDAFDEPRSGPFYFTDEHNKKKFAKGFAKCTALKLSKSRFFKVDGEYHFQSHWQGIPTERNGLSCYSLSLPQFAVPTKIRFKDPHSDHEYSKAVVRDDRRKCFVAYLRCSSRHGTFEFSLEVGFRHDPDKFPRYEFKDEPTAGHGADKAKDLAAKQIKYGHLVRYVWIKDFEAGTWRVSVPPHPENILVLKHCVGLAYIRVVLGARGQEIPAFQVQALAPEKHSYHTAGNHRQPLEGLGDFESSQVVLDDEAKREYRGRLESIRGEIEEAERWSNRGRIASLRGELKQIVDQLNRATGKNKRTRDMGSPQAAARQAVQKGIVRAIQLVSRSDAAAGQFLKRYIRTGWKVSYAGPEVEWQFEKAADLPANYSASAIQ